MPDNSKKDGPEQQTKLVTMAIGDRFPGEITAERAREMGITEWRLSDRAIQNIENIESNIRLAESQSGVILVS